MKKLFLFCLLLLFLFPGKSLGSEKEKWKGLDEAVIEKLAEDKGRTPKSLINLEGDLEITMFTLVSGVAGFIAGYYWRKIFQEGKNGSPWKKNPTLLAKTSSSK